MVVDDQREIIEFLSSPAAYGPDATPVERIETHSSMVFLTGNRAFKLKRAVKYDYLDFSTSSRRRDSIWASCPSPASVMGAWH